MVTANSTKTLILLYQNTASHATENGRHLKRDSFIVDKFRIIT